MDLAGTVSCSLVNESHVLTEYGSQPCRKPFSSPSFKHTRQHLVCLFIYRSNVLVSLPISKGVLEGKLLFRCTWKSQSCLKLHCYIHKCYPPPALSPAGTCAGAASVWLWGWLPVHSQPTTEIKRKNISIFFYFTQWCRLCPGSEKLSQNLKS